MIALTLAEVADAVGGRLADVVDPGSVVTGPVVTDSRTVTSGSLFVALAGDQVDGHRFAATAVQAGAVAVLAGREVGVPAVVVDDVTEALGALARAVLARLRTSGGPRVTAVTGSFGKTTTKDLLAQVLSADGATVAPVASFNNEIGLPLTVLRADGQTRHLVLEMGASALGELTYLTGIAPPDVAVVLAVGSAHLGEFGGIEAVATAKSEIVAGLLPTGVAVLNADDTRVMAMAPLAPGPVVTFGLGAAAEVRAVDVVLDDAGRPGFTLTTADGQAQVQLQLVGEHHVANALAAAAVALQHGLDLDRVAAGLTAAQVLSPHRMHVVDRPDGVRIVDDSYNANPESVRAALKALAIMGGRTRRTVAVLGEMLELGPDTRFEHEAVGRLAVRLDIDLLVAVGPGAAPIDAGATQEGSWGRESVAVADLDEARALLARELTAGDVVLVKSSHGSGLWRLADELIAGDLAPAGGAR